MIELNSFANILQTALNDNTYGITFAISTDRGVYDEQRKNTQGFIVPGVLTALSGDYEPLQGLKVYSMPVNLELWCYAVLDDELYKPTYTLEQQKECVSTVVENLNGTTQVIDGNVVVFTGTVLTVGEPRNNSGGGCTRIPVLLQVVPNGVQNAVLANAVGGSIDGFELIPINFTVQKDKTGGSQTITGTTNGTVINTQQSRVFNGSCYLTEYTPSTTGTPASAMEILENELLDDVSQNTPHTLVYRGRTYNVTFQSVGETLQAGVIVIISFTMTEFPSQFLGTGGGNKYAKCGL